MEALGAIGFFLLLAHVTTHVALVVAVARVKPARLSRAAFAFFFPPAGVVWGWEAGKKAGVIAYGATLVAFVMVVTAIAWARG